MSAELVEELRKIEAFSDLSEDDLAWLAGKATVYNFKAGELIMREGEPADRMTIILDGELQGRKESLGADAPVYTGRAGQVQDDCGHLGYYGVFRNGIPQGGHRPS